MSTHAQMESTAMSAPGSNLPRWILFFIACGCMFVLGVMVGRNTAPVSFDMDNLNSRLSRIPSSVLTETEDTADELETESMNDMPFEFYDKLREGSDSGGTEYTGDSPSGDVPLKEPKYQKNEKIPAAVTVAELNSKEEAEEQPAGSNAARQTTRTEKRRSDTVSEVSGYVIQVVSLRDPQRAETVREKFHNKGYPAYTREALVEGKGKWWRVRLGPYGSKSQARNDLVRLQKAGVDAIILMVTDEND